MSVLNLCNRLCRASHLMRFSSLSSSTDSIPNSHSSPLCVRASSKKICIPQQCLRNSIIHLIVFFPAICKALCTRVEALERLEVVLPFLFFADAAILNLRVSTTASQHLTHQFLEVLIYSNKFVMVDQLQGGRKKLLSLFILINS